MKRLLAVPAVLSLALLATSAHAATDIIILDVMRHPNNPLYWLALQAAGRMVGV